MKRLVLISAVLLLPASASAHELGFTHPHPAAPQAAIGQIETLTAQILAGKLDEVETEYLKTIAAHIEDMQRLQTDAKRRKDSIAVSCVEQKLGPARDIRVSAAKAAARLRTLSTSDIQALNAEAKALNVAADRVAELTTEARACLTINSGQVVTDRDVTPDIEPEAVKSKDNEMPDDSLVPREPEATNID